jgi:hypothetical protein
VSFNALPNTAYAKTPVTAKYTALKSAQDAELTAQIALGTARDGGVAAEWEFHNTMLAVKEQVIAQFWENSDQGRLWGSRKSPNIKRRDASQKLHRKTKSLPFWKALFIRIRNYYFVSWLMSSVT